MLKQRIITGVVLISAFLSAIAFLPLFWLAVVFGLVVSMGAWEWSRLAGWESWLLRFLYVGVLIGLVSIAYLYVPLDTAPLAKDIALNQLEARAVPLNITALLQRIFYTLCH